MTDRADSPEARAAMEHVRLAEGLAADIPGLPADEANWTPGRAVVVGAGTMGVGITAALVSKGLPVTLIDRSQDDVERGLARLDAIHGSSVKRGRLEQAEAERRHALVTIDTDLAASADADLVIEAVYEDLSTKQEVFRALDRQAPPGALLGTNTSALDIDAIASVTQRPQDVIGTHFFSPAHVMRLLEVVPGKDTSLRTLARLMALARHLGKVAVRAGNTYGFIGNAMLIDYLRQTVFLLEEGALPSDVDRALQDFGLAMGPFAMGDLAGLDIGVENRRKAIAEHADGRRTSDLDLHLVDLGRLGQKNGRGWYRYGENDRTPHVDPQIEQLLVERSARLGIARRHIDDEQIVQRTMYALVNRAAWLLGDGIADKPSDVDVVYVTGYGFPAWRGGPLHWADRVGLPAILARVEAFRAEQGAWWEPAPLLTRLVDEGSSFADLQGQRTSDR